MPQPSVEFGAKLRAWRIHLGRSQVEVERRAGLAHNAVSRIENGDVAPRLGTLERIADALEISVEQLQFRSPPASARSEIDDVLSGEVRRLLDVIAELPVERRPNVVTLLRQIVEEMNR